MSPRRLDRRLIPMDNPLVFARPDSRGWLLPASDQDRYFTVRRARPIRNPPDLIAPDRLDEGRRRGSIPARILGAETSMKPLPLCNDCGRRIEARRRWPFGDTLCRRCYAKAWVERVLALLPF
jgi:hypothetical protein